MLRKSHAHPRRYAEPQLDLFEAYDVLDELRKAGALDEPETTGDSQSGAGSEKDFSPKREQHVCGLQGYNPGPPHYDPPCPRCEQLEKQR